MRDGERLRDYRRKRGVTQDALATELGFAHASQVSRYETGGRRLTPRKLAEALAAIERIVERRGKTDPLSALEVSR